MLILLFIASSTISLTYPAKVTLVEKPTLNWNFDSAWEGDRIILTTSGIAEDEDLILIARFARNSLTQIALNGRYKKNK